MYIRSSRGRSCCPRWKTYPRRRPERRLSACRQHVPIRAFSHSDRDPVITCNEKNYHNHQRDNGIALLECQCELISVWRIHLALSPNSCMYVHRERIPLTQETLTSYYYCSPESAARVEDTMHAGARSPCPYHSQHRVPSRDAAAVHRDP